MKAFLKSRMTTVSLIFVGGVCLLAVAAPFVTPFSYEEQNVDRVLLPPNSVNFMGTDSLGRDLYSRIIYGARVSVAIGIICSIVTLLIGAAYGAVAGYKGRAVDSVMMRLVDLLQSIPALVFMILMMALLQPLLPFADDQWRSVVSLIIALSLVGWVGIARLVRGQVLQVKEMAYVESAQALGASTPAIILRHILPNIRGPLIVLLTYQVPSLVLYESFLSFIGLGLQPPYSSWGVLANEGWRSLRTYPHLILFPGLAIFLTMISFNLLGEGLREIYDPHANAGATGSSASGPDAG
jgi:oligopeptide transport system permease protein